MIRKTLVAGIILLLVGGSSFGQAPAAPAPPPAPPPPANPQDVKQINVSVKIVEFQTTKGVQSGLSAYLVQRTKKNIYGKVVSGFSAVKNADLTFPASTSAITVFLDQIRIG